MSNRNISMEIMEYMVWVIEITAAEFFGRDKTAAYNALHDSGLWDIYIENFDATHSLGKECLVDEMREYFLERGVIKP